MNIKPQEVAAAYEFLLQLTPFNRWNLPETDGVEFRTDMRKNVLGEHNYRARKRLPPLIRMSLRCNGHLISVLQTVAHEMCHLAQVVNGEREGHQETFAKRASAVCREFGWDERAF